MKKLLALALLLSSSFAADAMKRGNDQISGGNNGDSEQKRNTHNWGGGYSLRSGDYVPAQQPSASTEPVAATPVAATDINVEDSQEVELQGVRDVIDDCITNILALG